MIKKEQDDEEYKDLGAVDFEDHELEIIRKQAEKTNEQLEEMGL